MLSLGYYNFYKTGAMRSIRKQGQGLTGMYKTTFVVQIKFISSTVFPTAAVLQLSQIDGK
jgi:hypothetical protein